MRSACLSDIVSEEFGVFLLSLVGIVHGQELNFAVVSELGEQSQNVRNALDGLVGRTEVLVGITNDHWLDRMTSDKCTGLELDCHSDKELVTSHSNTELILRT